MKFNNFAMFDTLSLVFDTESNIGILPWPLETGVLQHLATLKNEFERYLSASDGDDFDFARTRTDYQLKKCLELKMDSSAKYISDEKSIIE